jgi:hypothetical protein
MAGINAQAVIHRGQELFREWVEGNDRRSQIESLLAADVVLYDYDVSKTFSGRQDVLDRLAALANETEKVKFYKNRVLGDTVVGLDHLDWKPATRMAPHDCVDLFKVNAQGEVTEVRICFVKS